MTRGVRLYLVGSLVLLGLAGCGRGWLQEREPWRRQAEAACIKSGAVKAGPSIVSMRSIDGPGVCGADYPLKVAALGESSVLGYADVLRPPGLIPRAGPVYAPPAPPPQPTYTPPQRAPSAPMPVERELSAPMPLDPALHAPQGGRIYESQQDPYAQSNSGAPRGRGFEPSPDDPDDEPAADAPLPRLGPVQPIPSAVTAIKPAATLACPMVSALDNWIANAVQPAALRWLGQPVAEIRQISAYSCRGMNGQRGAPISEHAFGNALDIAAFTLADGRKVTVKDGWRGAPEEQGFLRDVHAAACQQFSTVLAPGSNIYHYDHIHIDLARRASGRAVCNPKATPGDLVARRSDLSITGSVTERGRGRILGFAPETERAGEFSRSLPRAVPGED